MNTFHFLESKRHLEFDVGCGIGVVGELLMVVVAVFFVAETKGFVPSESPFFPLLEPFELFAGTNEELHLHLLEFAHAEDELTRYDLIAECFTDLCNAERNAHAACFLHVEIVDEDALCGFRTEIDGHCAVGGAAHLGLEHKVELAHFRPVACSGDGTCDFLIYDDLTELFKVVVVHSLREAFVQSLTFCNVFGHTGIGLTEQSLVERLAEAFTGFGNLFLYFVVHLGYLLFDQHVGAVAFLRVAVVDQGIVECVNVARCFPDGGVHEDGRVNAYYILMEKSHRIPPVSFYIVFELYTVLAIIINSGEAVVDFA